MGRAVDQRAGAIHRPPDHTRVGQFFDGHGFAGDHAFIDIGTATCHGPVYGDLFTGARMDQIADGDRVDRNL